MKTDIKNSISNINSTFFTYIFLCISIIFALVLSIKIQYPHITDVYSYFTNIRIHVWWMYQFQDPSLFQNDYLINIAKCFSTTGYYFIFYLASFFLDPVVFSKIIAIPICVITSFFCFMIGKQIRGNISGFLLANIFILTQYGSLSEGEQRSFIFPIIAGFLYFFLKKDSLKTCITVLLAALFYQPVFLLISFTYALSFLSGDKKQLFLNLKSKEFLVFVITVFIAVLVNIPGAVHRKQVGLTLNKYLSWQQIQTMPEFSPGGRRQLFSKTTLSGKIFDILGNNPRIGTTLIDNFHTDRKLLLFLSVITFIILGRKSFRIPKEVWLLLLSGIILYIIAFTFMMIFYLPHRYMAMSWPLFLAIYISFNFESVLNKIWSLLRIGNHVRESGINVLSAVVLLLCTYSYSSNNNFLEYDNTLSYLLENNKPIFKFVKTLPKNSIIAGDPLIMNNIPILSKRSVYINEQFEDQTAEIKRRYHTFINAFFSAKKEDINNFCKVEKVDYILVNPDSIKSQKIISSFSGPYREYISDKFYKKKSDFVILNVPKSTKIDIPDTNNYLINCKKL